MRSGGKFTIMLIQRANDIDMVGWGGEKGHEGIEVADGGTALKIISKRIWGGLFKPNCRVRVWMAVGSWKSEKRWQV